MAVFNIIQNFSKFSFEKVNQFWIICTSNECHKIIKEKKVDCIKIWCTGRMIAENCLFDCSSYFIQTNLYQNNVN